MAHRHVIGLGTGWTAAHLADQLLLAWLPLLLVSRDVAPSTVGVVVAAHATAWLLVSLPAGAYADRASRRDLIAIGGLLLIIAAAAGIATATAGVTGPVWLALMAFCAASGVVTIALSVFALVPSSIGASGLSQFNARLEFARAVACIAAPLLASALVLRRWDAIVYGVVAAAGLLAMAASRALPDEPPPAAAAGTVLQAIAEGGRFVAGEPVLRAIAVCAVAWNAAFFALTAIIASFAARRLDMSIAAIGGLWSTYGAGLLLGALAAPLMIARLRTGFMMAFGPLVSGLGVLTLASLGPWGSWTAYLAFFALGFGPMTWLVLQTSVRQLLTPKRLLGRVGSVITTAIYGVRPLGALAASAVAANAGLDAALWIATGLFLVSAVSILVSPAARLVRLPDPAPT